MKNIIVALTTSAIFVSAVAAAPANAQLMAPPVGTLGSVLTPGIVGDTVQVGVGRTRIGAVNGLIGDQGRPTTKVGVNVLTEDHPPQGSVATISVPRSAGQSLRPN